MDHSRAIALALFFAMLLTLLFLLMFVMTDGYTSLPHAAIQQGGNAAWGFQWWDIRLGSFGSPRLHIVYNPDRYFWIDLYW